MRSWELQYRHRQGRQGNDECPSVAHKMADHASWRALATENGSAWSKPRSDWSDLPGSYRLMKFDYNPRGWIVGSQEKQYRLIKTKNKNYWTHWLREKYWMDISWCWTLILKLNRLENTNRWKALTATTFNPRSSPLASWISAYVKRR